MRWDYKSPAPQQIVSDGTSLWVYTPELNQVNKGNAPKALAGPAGSFLSGLGKLREEFTVRFLNPASPRDGAGRPVLDLTPKQPTPLLTRLVLTVDPKDYVVRQAVLYDQFQNTVTMTFNKVHDQPGPQRHPVRLHAAEGRGGGAARPALARGTRHGRREQLRRRLQDRHAGGHQRHRPGPPRHRRRATISRAPRTRSTPEKMDIIISSTDDMKLKAVLDILQSKLHRRGIDLKALTINDPEPGGGGIMRQKITLQDGVPMEKAKEIVRLIKDSKLKVQASIQEKQVRVVGQEPRRPAGGHRAAQGQGPRHRAPVHELPLHLARPSRQ